MHYARCFLFCLILCCAGTSSAATQQIIINAVGDIMLAGSGAATYARLGYDYPFTALQTELKKADLTVGNLEAPITRRGTEFTQKKYRFKTSPAAATALRKAGFSVLTLANNHMMDFGATGLRETLQRLNENRLLHTGAGRNLAEARKSTVTSINGKTVAFLAYSLTYPAEFYAGKDSHGTAPGFAPFYTTDIMRAKSSYDYVIVSFHWGAELATAPKQYQILVAHRAIDAGADLVIGHHPHVLQGIETYKKGVILYSLGNFTFGSMSRSSDIGALARITLNNGINAVELIPLNVLNSEIHYQPKILHGEPARTAIRRIAELSRPLGTTIISRDGRYFVKMPFSDCRRTGN